MNGFVGVKTLFLVILTKGMSGCGSPSAFEQAQELNTIEAWEGFLKLAPQGDEQRTAIERLAQLYWDKAESSDSVEDWEAFADRGIGTDGQRWEARATALRILMNEAFVRNTVEAWSALGERSLQGIEHQAGIEKLVNVGLHQDKVVLTPEFDTPPHSYPEEYSERCHYWNEIVDWDDVERGKLKIPFSEHPLAKRGLLVKECVYLQTVGFEFRRPLRPGVRIQNVSDKTIKSLKLSYQPPFETGMEAARYIGRENWGVNGAYLFSVSLEPGETRVVEPRFMMLHELADTFYNFRYRLDKNALRSPSPSLDNYILKWLDEGEWRIDSIRVED